MKFPSRECSKAQDLSLTNQHSIASPSITRKHILLVTLTSTVWWPTWRHSNGVTPKLPSINVDDHVYVFSLNIQCLPPQASPKSIKFCTSQEYKAINDNSRKENLGVHVQNYFFTKCVFPSKKMYSSQPFFKFELKTLQVHSFFQTVLRDRCFLLLLSDSIANQLSVH